MNVKRSSIVAASVVMCLAIEGCESVSTKEDAKVTNSTKDEGTLVGAGTGGVIAGIGTYLLTGDGDKAMKAAAIGAVVGAAAGYFIGQEIYKQQSQFASTEDFLDHHINLARENNKIVSKGNKELETQIAQFNKEVDSLNANYEKGAATRRELYAQREKIEQQLAKEQKNTQQLQARLDNQIKAIAETEAEQAELAKQATVKLAKLRVENERFRKAVNKHSQLMEELQTTSDALEG